MRAAEVRVDPGTVKADQTHHSCVHRQVDDRARGGPVITDLDDAPVRGVAGDQDGTAVGDAVCSRHE
jgi:hypothetical protein